MHLYKHLIYSGATPPGEVAKPKAELAHRDKFVKVVSGLDICDASLQSSDMARGEAPRRGGEAKNRARSSEAVFTHSHMHTYTYIYLQMFTNILYIYIIRIRSTYTADRVK